LRQKEVNRSHALRRCGGLEGRTKMKRITPPSAEKLRQLYTDLSINEMSERLGASATMVNNWLDAAHIEKRPKGPITGRMRVSEVRTEDVVRVFQEQLRQLGRPNYNAIGRQFGLTRQGVRYRLKVANVELPAVANRLKLPVQEIMREYEGDSAVTLDSLAEEWGCGATKIHRILVAAGAKMRPREAVITGRWKKVAPKIVQLLKPGKPGRRKKADGGGRYVEAGRLVEQKLADGKELTAARLAVARQFNLAYSSVVRYHRKFRKHPEG
jgi:hypothetical protein